MEGKNFFRATVTPPPISNLNDFVFDLQRFGTNGTFTEITSEDHSGATIWIGANETDSNGKYYNCTDLQDAINTVADGGYIKLLTNFETGGAVATYATAGTKQDDGTYLKDNRYYCRPKNFTVDFGGYSYTVSNGLVGSTGTVTQAFHLEKPTSNYNNTITLAENGNVNITFKNGSIIVGNQINASMFIQNYCNVTYQDITLDGTNLKGPGCYVSSNNCGDVKILGNTSILAKEGDYAFDVCVYASYPSVSVTVNTTGVIDGKIELSKSLANSFTKQGKLDIQKAVITKEIKYDKSLISEVNTVGFTEKITIAEDVTVGDVDYGNLIRYVAENGDVVFTPGGWYKPSSSWYEESSESNQWLYLDKQAESSFVAKSFATLEPDTSDETALNLTTAKDVVLEEKTLFLDMTADAFKDLTYTKIKVTDTTGKFAFHIKGNDTIKEIKGGSGADTLVAGSKGATLEGGEGADSLVGGKGEDTFIYSGGDDVINNYDIKNDVVSLTSDITPTTDTKNIESISTGLKLTFSEGNTLSFDKNAVSIVSGESTYYYTPNSILLNGTSISLGANHDSLFNAASSDYRDNLKDIDASKVLKEIRIIGNDLNNVIIGGASGSIFGGDGNDTLKAGANGSTLNGGEGADSLVGGAGADTFIFNSGADSINGYDSTKDLVSIPDSLRPESAIVSVDSSNNLVLDFDGGDKLTFVSAKAPGTTEDLAVSLTSNDRNMYIFKKDRVETYLFDKDSILLSKSVSLTSAYDTNAAFEVSDYDSVDASAVTGAVSILGGEENKSSYIIGSNKGGTLGGGAGGNDRLDVNDRDNSSKYTFVYTAGRDTVFGFEDGDNVSLTAESIASAKNGNGKFTFTIKANKNVLTLNGEDVDKVNLTGGNYLTADGFVDTTSKSLKLFTSANGTIDLTDDPYKATTINSVIADSVKSQSVHLVASSLVSAVTFAEKNKMKDVFEYNGGNVTVTNYEVGKDKINLGDGEISGFTVTGNDVEISVDSYTGTNNKVTLKDVAGKEILVHHAESKGSNTYDKMIFKESNVLFNKDSSATSVTISSGAQGFSVGNNTSIKKITVESGVSGISITAGDSNNTTIDASASDGVTLIGGKKNDKLFGSTEKNDTFVYGNEGTAKSGKDVIQNYGDGDKVSLYGGNFALEKVQKVAANNNSVKLTFDNSNILTIKGEVSDGISINSTNYTFKKNAIIGNDDVASLTSGASGNIKLDKLGGITKVTAENVDKNKNLTLTGTKEADSIVGGGKKTTFKGGGDNDTLVGGSGADTFVYTKGIAGDVTIQNFDFANDNLKIANGTITSISSVAGGVKFSMNNGRKNSNNIGYFTVTSSIASGSEGTALDPSKIVIKANNNFYWFASGDEVLSSDDTKKATLGDLITASGSKKSDFDSSFNVIDLGYSTNLVKSGVAFKVNSPYKKTTT